MKLKDICRRIRERYHIICGEDYLIKDMSNQIALEIDAIIDNLTDSEIIHAIPNLILPKSLFWHF